MGGEDGHAGGEDGHAGGEDGHAGTQREGRLVEDATARLNVHLRAGSRAPKQGEYLVNALGRTATGVLLPLPKSTLEVSFNSSIFTARPRNRSAGSPFCDLVPGSSRVLQARSQGPQRSSFLTFGYCRCHRHAGSRVSVALLDPHPSSAASLVQGQPKLRRFPKSLIGMLPAREALAFHLLGGSPLQEVPLGILGAWPTLQWKGAKAKSSSQHQSKSIPKGNRSHLRTAVSKQPPAVFGAGSSGRRRASRRRG